MTAETTTDATDTDGLDRLVRGYQFTQALHVAARLGSPGLVADGPQSAADLAARCGAHAPALARLLRALTTLGVFAEVAPEVFGPTPRSQLLRDGVPGSRRAMLMLSGSQLYAGWGQLLHTIQTGETTARRIYGMDSWEWRAQHPEMNAIFNDAMVEGMAVRVAALLAVYDFAPFGTVVDVAGGRGTLLAGILRAYPGVRGVLFDLPHVVAGADAAFAAAGVAERASVVPGSFFEAVPAGGDAYILSAILHDWDDERATAILATCRRAMAGRGALLLFERVLPDGADRPWLPYFGDVNMLQGLGGRERTEAEWRALLASAGFTLTQIVPTASGFGVIEARPAATVPTG